MQGLAKLLVIEDDAQARVGLRNILEFVGEPCEAISSAQLSDVDWSSVLTGCILGSMNNQGFSTQLNGQLLKSSHVPLLMLGPHTYPVEEMTNYVGELEYPLNYPQLSEALRHCKEFLGRQGINHTASSRDNTLFRSLVGQSIGIQEVRHLYRASRFDRS